MEKRKLSDRVVEYILTLDIDEFESITVNKIAKEFSVNRSYLSKKFKTDKQVNLNDYIIMVKILRVSYLLVSGTNMTIEELAKKMGYANTDYFSNLFKKRIGTTPGKYKTYLERTVTTPQKPPKKDKNKSRLNR